MASLKNRFDIISIIENIELYALINLNVFNKKIYSQKKNLTFKGFQKSSLIWYVYML